MKGYFVATVALGALFSVDAATPPEGNAMEKLSEALASASNIDWSMFTPENMGMQLNYDEMSEEELKKVVQAFVKLGFVNAEQSEELAAALQHPSMRNMLEKASENWPQTVSQILGDPKNAQIFEQLKDGVDLDALAEAVGISGGLEAAAEKLEENLEVAEKENEDEQEVDFGEGDEAN